MNERRASCKSGRKYTAVRSLVYTEVTSDLPPEFMDSEKAILKTSVCGEFKFLKGEVEFCLLYN